MAIPRKTVRKAVCRNRIKRVIRDSFRHHRLELREIDVVVLARAGLDRVDNARLRRLLAAHWRYLAKRGARPPSHPAP